MKEVRYTLLSEGTSDKALLPILSWLIRLYMPEYAVQASWADLASFPNPPKKLEERIKVSLDYYPCDVLFIHRDADGQGRSQRINEIDEALCKIDRANPVPAISVIPVRMTEAWLLCDESSIRIAADNPKGCQKLVLPKLRSIEKIADPKDHLHKLLRQASEVSGRRLKKFNARISSRVQRISEIIDDFSILRELKAFKELESSIHHFAQQNLH